MEKHTENNANSKELSATHQEQDELLSSESERSETPSSINVDNARKQDNQDNSPTFDIDAFVHGVGEGHTTTHTHTDTDGAIDTSALGELTPRYTQGAGELTRKEKKERKRELKREQAQARERERQAKKNMKDIKSQLKDRDKELSDKFKDARKKRDSAKNVVKYIGYNRM